MAASCFDCVWVNNGIFFPGSGCAPGDGLPYARFTESWGIRFTSPDTTWALSTAGSFLAGYVSSGTNYGAGNILACGCISIGTTEFVTSNGNAGRILKMASNNNNIITAETSTTNRYMIFESRRQSRTGDPRNAQLSLGGDSSDNGEIIFETAPASSGVSERMRITSAGNVGIGTTSPSAKLHVNGTSQFDDSLTFPRGAISWGGNPTRFMITSCGTYNLGFGTDNFTDRMTIQCGTGNVGINTTNPSTKFHVCNPVNQAYTPTSFNSGLHAIHIQFCNQNQRAGLIRWTSHGNLENTFGVVQIGCSNEGTGCGQGDFVFQAYRDPAAYSELMRLTRLGNVGIGTSSPLSRLHISGQSGTTGLPSFLLYGESPSNGQRYGLNVSSDQLDVSALGTNARIAFFTGGNASTAASQERMRITSGGRLLINTTSDAGDYKLQVNGNGVFVDSGTPLIELRKSGATDWGSIRYDGTNLSLGTYSGGSESMRITSGGTVGFAVTPAAQNGGALAGSVEVGGVLRIQGGGGRYFTSGDGLEILKTSIYSYNRGTSTYNDLGINDSMTVKGAGQVKIGSNSSSMPSALLSVGSAGYGAFGILSYGQGVGTWDSGITINQGNAGMAMLVLASIHTSDGTATQSALYLVNFYYSGNNTPAATHVAGNNFVTFGKSGSNTLTLTTSGIALVQYALIGNK